MIAADYRTTIQVTQPEHLCAVQIATRQFCRTIGFNDGAVFDAVLGVSEIAHRLLVRSSRAGQVDLSAVRTDSGYCLHAEVKPRPAEQAGSSRSESATFPPQRPAVAAAPALPAGLDSRKTKDFKI